MDPVGNCINKKTTCGNGTHEDHQFDKYYLYMTHEGEWWEEVAQNLGDPCLTNGKTLKENTMLCWGWFPTQPSCMIPSGLHVYSLRTWSHGYWVRWFTQLYNGMNPPTLKRDHHEKWSTLSGGSGSICVFCISINVYLLLVVVYLLFVGGWYIYLVSLSLSLSGQWSMWTAEFSWRLIRD